MEASTSASPPQVASQPNRIVGGVSEGEIQRLQNGLEGLSTSIKSLKDELGGLCSSMVDLSEAEGPSSTAKIWMKQVGELCHDTEDYYDELLQSGEEIKILADRAIDANARRTRYKIDPRSFSKPRIPLVAMGRRRFPAVHGNLIDHGPMAELENFLDIDPVAQLKVASLVGPEGIGKTTLAQRLYRKLGGKFRCRAFVRVSPNPDMRRLLTSIFVQIHRKQASCALKTQDLISDIAEHLLDKRYLIVIDDIWSTSVWDIISDAFPDNKRYGRIITTTQIEHVALASCGYQPDYTFKMVPLGDDQSRKFFSKIVFGSEDGPPQEFKQVSDVIIRKCGRLPLGIINIASMLPASPPKLEEWTGIRDLLPSALRTKPTSEGMKEVVKLMYNNLRPHMKTCLLYFSMYPEGYTVRKDDLVKQWVAESLLDGNEEQGTEEVAGGYFDELVKRGLIQPVDTNGKGEVLSCTLHHTVQDFIVNTSMEENFIITVDYFQSSMALPDKARRMSVQFGAARSAKVPESIMESEVRSLAFFGFFDCMPPIEKYRLLRVLILHIWADQDKPVDLAIIGKLYRLRYHKIECNITVKLPAKIEGLQYLETLDAGPTVAAIPSDIGELSRLSILKIAVSKLSAEHICILQELPALTTLSLHVWVGPTERRIVFGEEGFTLLTYFKFTSTALCLSFSEGAMPRVHSLMLRFNATEFKTHDPVDANLKHLSGLKEISAKIGTLGADESDSKAALMDIFKKLPSNPSFNVQMVDRIFYEKSSARNNEEQYQTTETQDAAGSGTSVAPGTPLDELDQYAHQEKDEGSEEIQSEQGDISTPSFSRRPTVSPLPVVLSPDTEVPPSTAHEVEDTQDEARPSAQKKHGIQKKDKEEVSRKHDEAKATLSTSYPARSNPYPKRGGNMSRLPMDYIMYTLAKRIIGRLIHMMHVGGFEFIKRERQLLTIIIEENKEGELAEKWVLQLQELTCDIEDFMYIDSRLSIRSVLHAVDHISKMKQLERRITSIRKWQRAAASSHSDHTTATTGPTRYDSTPSDVREDELVGVAGPKDDLLQLLRHDSSDYASLRVISIVGCSGSGKSTLAAVVYGDLYYAQYFDCRAWVVASSCNSAADLLNKIFQQLVPQEASKTTGDDNLLKQFLSTRYFLVIDQLQLAEVWYGVEDLFRRYANLGSRILVTTTIQSVAAAAASLNSSSHLYSMPELGYDESKKLFRRKALVDGSESILRKCNGLPLALVSTANYLRMGKISRYPGDARAAFGEMNRALLECYNSLPDNGHRTCLLSLSIYPEGYLINRKSVIRRWVAERLVAGDGTCSAEEVAGARFDELIDRNLIQPVHIGINSKAKRCQIHSVMVEFVVNKSISKNLVTLIRKDELVPNVSPHPVRQLCVQGGTSVSQIRIDSVIGSSAIRSLTVLRGLADFKSCKLLRVLDLEGCHGLNKRIFYDICGLLFLKYLSLRGSDVGVVQIPKKIRRLDYLETVDLRKTAVRKFPMELIMLPRLAHLFGKFELPQELRAGKKKRKLEHFFSEISRMQTLSGFFMDENGDYVTTLLQMRSLRKVKIFVTWAEEYLVSFIQECFTGSNTLESLSIDFRHSHYSANFLDSVQAPCLLNSIKICGKLGGLPRFLSSVDTTLSELQLSSTGLSWEELSVLQRLHFLHYLKLSERRPEFEGDIFCVEQGGFPNLLRLCLEGRKLPLLRIEQGAMPLLSSLELLFCPGTPLDSPGAYWEERSLGVEGLSHLTNLNEVILHHSAPYAAVQAWKAHINRPWVSVKKKPGRNSDGTHNSWSGEVTEVA